MTAVPTSVPAAPDVPDDSAASRAARTVFGDHVAQAERYAQLLAGPGITRGLIGPREAGRIWSRHLLNSAVLTAQVPQDARVVDVGSGAGLPGIPIAIRRADLTVDLVEPMLRRTTFLVEAVTTLELDSRVRVVRGRAPEPAVIAQVGGADVVVARALAPLDRLASWCLPLTRPGGIVLALKGASASAELDAHRAGLLAMGADTADVLCINSIPDVPPTWVIRIVAGTRKR